MLWFSLSSYSHKKSHLWTTRAISSLTSCSNSVTTLMMKTLDLRMESSKRIRNRQGKPRRMNNWKSKEGSLKLLKWTDVSNYIQRIFHMFHCLYYSGGPLCAWKRRHLQDEILPTWATLQRHRLGLDWQTRWSQTRLKHQSNYLYSWLSGIWKAEGQAKQDWAEEIALWTQENKR